MSDSRPRHGHSDHICSLPKQLLDAYGNLMASKMSRSIIPPLLLISILTGCDTGPSGKQLEEEAKRPHSLEELLRLHDKVVSYQGKDLYFIQPIGRFGKEGIEAAISHIEHGGGSASSYNSMELLLGIAVEARAQTGYDICEDEMIMQRFADIVRKAKYSSWEPSSFDEYLVAFCKVRTKQ